MFFWWIIKFDQVVFILFEFFLTESTLPMLDTECCVLSEPFDSLFLPKHSASTASCTSGASILQRHSPESPTMIWAFSLPQTPNWRTTWPTWCLSSKVLSFGSVHQVDFILYCSVLVNLFVPCVAEWLFECTVQKLVLVITCLETNEVLERWQFDIECDKSAKESRSAPLTTTRPLFINSVLSKSLIFFWIIHRQTVWLVLMKL